MGKHTEPEQHGNGLQLAAGAPLEGRRGSPGAARTPSCLARALQPAFILLQPATPGLSDLVHEVLFLARGWQRSFFKRGECTVGNGVISGMA